MIQLLSNRKQLLAKIIFLNQSLTINRDFVSLLVLILQTVCTSQKGRLSAKTPRPRDWFATFFSDNR